MIKLLYICTHNRCRSILSEAITNHEGAGTLEARSAGSQPCGEVHPLSLTYLTEANIAIHNLQSQSWHEFENYQPDIVITVCDAAANEACPVWFGDAIQVHWPLKDPSKLEGSEQEKADAFRSTINEIRARVTQLIALDLPALSKQNLKPALRSIGLEVKG